MRWIVFIMSVIILVTSYFVFIEAKRMENMLYHNSESRLEQAYEILNK